MDTARRERLEEAGFRVGTVADFLGLTPEENELVEIGVALSVAFKKQCRGSRLSQAEIAERIGSTESRVAKMEAGDPHASLGLLIKALVTLGMTRGELADVIAPHPSR